MLDSSTMGFQNHIGVLYLLLWFVSFPMNHAVWNRINQQIQLSSKRSKKSGQEEGARQLLLFFKQF